MNILSFNDNRGKYFYKSASVIFSVFLVAICAMLGYFILASTENINENVYNSESSELGEKAINIANSFEEVAVMCSYISTMDLGHGGLDSFNSDYTDYLIVKNQMNAYLAIFNQIDAIYIQTASGSEFSSKNNFNTVELQGTTVGKIRNSQIYVVPDKDAYNTVIFQRKKDKISHVNNTACIALNALALGKKTLSYNKQRQEYLLDKNGCIISSYAFNKIGQNFSSLYNLKNFVVSDMQKEVSVDGVTYILTIHKIDNVDLYAVRLTDKDFYASYYHSNIWLIVLICTLILLIAIGICFALLRYFYKPINDILKQIEKYQDITIGHDTNEVEYIKRKLDQMCQNNIFLHKTVTEALSELKTWNIAALQAQICPHFLYNTLDAINWLSFKYLSDDNLISAATQNVAYIMRSSMDITRMFSTIEEEISITKKYIKIVDIRYENRYKIKWNVDNTCLNCIIPRLSIQPLIENAVIHAFPEGRDDNCITITISKLGDDVEIIVEDNGVGISPDELERLRSNIKNAQIQDNHNIGLKNINQRCQIIFGEEYGMFIESKLGKGSKFYLRLPADQQI